MHAAATTPDHEQLFAIAESQCGYFTMAQALEAGFARSTHSYHVKVGNWLREHRGIYRLQILFLYIQPGEGKSPDPVLLPQKQQQ